MLLMQPIGGGAQRGPTYGGSGNKSIERTNYNTYER